MNHYANVVVQWQCQILTVGDCSLCALSLVEFARLEKNWCMSQEWRTFGKLRGVGKKPFGFERSENGVCY